MRFPAFLGWTRNRSRPSSELAHVNPRATYHYARAKHFVRGQIFLQFGTVDVQSLS